MIEPVLLQPRAEPVEQHLRASNRRTGSESTQDRLECRQYIFMERAFRQGGGIVSGDQLAHLLRSTSWQPISLLARWIVGRKVISFDWHANTMLPLFQFDPSSMTIRQCVSQILRELTEVFDDWELAWWFAQPNAWLDHHAPVAVLDLDAKAVLDAARADRFIARG